MNEIVNYEVPNAMLTAYRNNYKLLIGNKSVTLIRDVDFGKVPKAKNPSLFKSGAEKVLREYGLYYDVQIVDSYKDYKTGFFYYECKAIAYHNGEIVRVGVGCANTNESSFGTSSGYNSANSALKKAKKRAVVDLALTLGSLSDAFTQDLESDGIDEQSKAILRDEDYVTPKQIKRLFAIAQAHELTVEKTKTLLTAWGYESTKTIKQKDYDEIVEKIEHYEE